MILKNLTNGGKKGRYIFTAHPLSASGIKYGFQFLHDKGDVTATAENGRNHPSKGNCPSVMFSAFGVYENFERTPPSILYHIIYGYIERVIALWPLNFISRALE